MFKLLSLIAVSIFCVGNFLFSEVGIELDHQEGSSQIKAMRNVAVKKQEFKYKISMPTKNVSVLDTAFYMPQLKRKRRIWIYLPESYHHTRKKYPVIYMQDGQNLFDEKTAFADEWSVDETMDSLGKLVGESIVIGIDNGGEKRMNEYSPYHMEKFGKGEGDKYVDFVVKTLKPFVDKKFRTRKDKKCTAIAGSSMGGLISFYAVLKYPKVFGAAGVFSPSFWIAPKLKDDILKQSSKVRSRIYFYAGKTESKEMVPDLLEVFELMSQKSKARMTTVIRTEGKHDEATWRKEFPFFYHWLML